MDLSQIQQLMLVVLGLALLASGIVLAGRSNKAQYSETARTGFNSLMAIVIGSLGLGAVAYAAFGKKILALFGIA